MKFDTELFMQILGCMMLSTAFFQHDSIGFIASFFGFIIMSDLILTTLRRL
jgi:hypothetical protein